MSTPTDAARLAEIEAEGEQLVAEFRDASGYLPCSPEERAGLRDAAGVVERLLALVRAQRADLAHAIAELRGDENLDDDLVGLSLMWIGGEELHDAFLSWYKPEDWPFGRHRAASAFLRIRLAEARAAGYAEAREEAAKRLMAITDADLGSIWAMGTGYWHDTRNIPKPSRGPESGASTGMCFPEAMRSALVRALTGAPREIPSAG